MNDRIRSKLLGLIQAKLDLPVADGDSLADLGLDSLAMAELVAEIETTFGIKSDASILDVDSLDELADYVSARIPGRGR